MSRNNFVIDTGEGCKSFVLATPDLVIRAWLDSQEPDVLGGHVTSVSYAGGRAMWGCGDADFIFRGGRNDLVALASGCGPVRTLADPRFEFAYGLANSENT